MHWSIFQTHEQLSCLALYTFIPIWQQCTLMWDVEWNSSVCVLTWCHLILSIGSILLPTGNGHSALTWSSSLNFSHKQSSCSSRAAARVSDWLFNDWISYNLDKQIHIRFYSVVVHFILSLCKIKQKHRTEEKNLICFMSTGRPDLGLVFDSLLVKAGRLDSILVFSPAS